MARKDLEKLVSYIRSDKKNYFEKALRDLKAIVPASIKAHDKATAETLVDELVSAYWYWDKRVPRVKDWSKVEGGTKLGKFVIEREEMRNRRDSVMELLMVARDVADHARLGTNNEKKGKIAAKIVWAIDDCEREWEMIAAKRIAEGESAGKWIVRVV